MRLQYELTLQDFLAAQQLHAKRSARAQFNYVGCFYIFPIVGILSLAFYFMVMRRSPTQFGLAEVLVAGGGVILLLLPLYTLWCWRRAYTRTRTGLGGCTLDFEAEQIKSRMEHASSEIGWPAIQRFAEGKKAFLLYFAQASFLVVPKRVCSAEQIDELRTLFQSKITPVAEK